MPVSAIASFIKNAFSAAPSAAALASKGVVHAAEHGTGHVNLDAYSHPLMSDEPRAMANGALAGKVSMPSTNGSAPLVALKNLASSVTNSPVAQLLERLPAAPALAPIQLARGFIAEKLAIAPSRNDSGGYLGQPQEPPILPGGSHVPPPQRKEEFLIDPEAMQPALTGRPEQRWVQSQEGFVPVGTKPSDLIHLSSEDDFMKSIRNLSAGAQDTRKIVKTLIDPAAIDREITREWEHFLSGPGTGADTLAGSVQRVPFSSNDQKVYLYRPTAEIMGSPATVMHPDVPGYNSYGVLASYFPQHSGLKVEINSNIPNFKDLKDHWGDSDAMMKGLLQVLEEDGIQPQHILLRPSELWEHQEWAQRINDNLINLRDRTQGSVRRNLNEEVNRLLSDVGGIGVLLDKGYEIVDIKPSPEPGAPLRVRLKRQTPPAL